jgi:heme/copper-type cytochrome/quinol oxidase subunit 2
MPPELQRRLQQLKARLEQQQYDAMVADVTQVRWLWLFI